MNFPTELRTRGRVAKALAALTVGLLVATTSNAANAANKDEAAVVVRYDDLDLQSQTGKDALLRRINRAAERVCGASQRSGRSWQRPHEHCMRESVRSALAQVPNSVLDETISAGRDATV